MNNNDFRFIIWTIGDKIYFSINVKTMFVEYYIVVHSDKLFRNICQDLVILWFSILYCVYIYILET